MTSDTTIFDEATIRFFRVPEDSCEYLEEDNNNNSETASQQQQDDDQQQPLRARILHIKTSLDALSLVACRRQGVLPSELGLPTAASSSQTKNKKSSQPQQLSWADKQHRLGLLRVLALERSRVATEIAEVLEKENDPQARLKMEQELKLVQRESGCQQLTLSDPDEQEMVDRLLSAHSSNATTAAIQQRMINAVRKRSERAVARMYRSHERVMHNEEENHKKRVDLVHHLQEREAVREKLKAERKRELHQKVTEQAELREKKMSALKIRFTVINEAKKHELEDKIKHSEELYEAAQQRQIDHLMQRSEKQYEKILTVQEQVARAKQDELDRRIQLDEERRQRDALHRERRDALLMKKDLRLEQRKRREELLQMKAKEQREARDQQLRKEFEEAHSAQLRASKQQEKEGLAGNKAARRASSTSSATNQQQNSDSRSRALAYSRPSSTTKQQQQQQKPTSAGDSSSASSPTTPAAASATNKDRHKAAREEMLRRQLLIQIQEEHNAKVLEERRIEAEAARRVRQREEQAKIEHNRENLKRKERADLHRQQLQQMLVEEQEKAAAQREKERLKAERKLQILKLDLARQREDAQERIREQEKRAHLKNQNQHGDDQENDEGAGDDHNEEEEHATNHAVGSPTPNKTTRAKEPPASSSSSPNKANPQNSAILSVVAGGKKNSISS